MDFIHDTQAGGGAIRVLAVLDVFNRECVALEARQTFRGGDMATVLGQVGRGRGLPEVIQCDQGTEFTSKALDHWAYWNQVKLDFSRPGKPTDNAVLFQYSIDGWRRRENPNVSLSHRQTKLLPVAAACGSLPCNRRVTQGEKQGKTGENTRQVESLGNPYREGL